MIRIYHFANLGYGRPFLERYAQLPEALLRQVRVEVIFSAWSPPVSASGRRRLRVRLHRWRQWMDYRWQFREMPFGVQLVPDVNAEAFRRGIAPGSFGICSGFNQIFSAATLECFRGVVNFHPSLLPYYRGPVPNYWCLQNGETQTGYTLHRMSARIDAGAILHQECLPIGAGDTERSLDEKLAQRASRLLGPWLHHLVEDRSWPVVEVEAHKVYRQLVDYRSFAPSSPQ
ncbi:MAG: formyltransferase family protein [Bacteroidota bacterium]